MQVLLLGPVAVVEGARMQPVRSSRQAAVLAVLASAAGLAVSSDRLIDAVWEELPPSTARNTLQVHVSALRRLLGAGAIRSTGDAYLLDVAGTPTDTDRFSRLTEEGGRLFDSGRYAEAARVLRAALALWRGDPLTGLTSSWARDERHRLTSLKLLAETTRVDADLALGRHLLVLDQLDRLCAEHPYDEHLATLRMLALYRGGRQQEALAVHDTMRRRLADELGVDPGAELRQMHQQVLAQDERLRPPDEVRAEQAPWRARTLGVASDPVLGALLGREGLLNRLGEVVRPGGVVTLVGPSGIGKTRVATEFARRAQATHRDGAAVVDGVALPGLDDLLLRVGAQMDSAEPVELTTLTALLEHGDALVVLDDLEAGPELVEVLAQLVARSRACWVVTAPRPLGIPGETVLPVPPLATGATDLTTGEPGAAVQLLLGRAAAAGATLGDDAPTLALASECAVLLDGIPLAIELAAPDAVLGLADLTQRLRRAAEHGGGSVAISFATSLDQLDAVERTLLEVLAGAGAPMDLELLTSVQLPGVATATAERIAHAVAALVRDGLVRRTPGPHGYAMFDLLASVAAEMTLRTAARRRDECARSLVAAGVTVFCVGQYLPSHVHSAEQSRRWMAHDAFGRRTVALALETGLLEEAAAITVALQEQVIEDRARTPDPALPATLAEREAVSAGRRTDLHLIAALQHLQLGDVASGDRHLCAALALARETGDEGRTAQVLANRAIGALQGWRALGDYADLADQALAHARRSGSAEVVASVLALRPIGTASGYDVRDGLRVAREHHLPGLEVLCLANWADHALEHGDLTTAERVALEAAALASDLHNACMTGFMNATLDAARAIAGSSTSLTNVANSLVSSWGVGEVRGATDALLKLAAGSRHRGEHERAAQCLGLFEALMADGQHDRSLSEDDLIHTWLPDVVPVPPATSLAEAVQRLAATFLSPERPRARTSAS